MRFASVIAIIGLVLAGCGEAPTASSESPIPATSPQVLLDIHGSGTKTTEKFTPNADWDLNWSYDCTAGLAQNGIIPSGYHCSFIVHIKKPDGHLSLENQGVSQLGVKDHSVEHYHTGGTFYLTVEVCCTDNTWTLKVTG